MDEHTAEIAALDTYQAKHSTCDIQQHPWHGVFGAGFGADFTAGYQAALSRDRAPAGAPGDVRAAAERLLADATTQQAWVDHEGETVTRTADVLLVARHFLSGSRGSEGLAAENTIDGIECPACRRSTRMSIRVNELREFLPWIRCLCGAGLIALAARSEGEGT